MAESGAQTGVCRATGARPYSPACARGVQQRQRCSVGGGPKRAEVGALDSPGDRPGPCGLPGQIRFSRLTSAVVAATGEGSAAAGPPVRRPTGQLPATVRAGAGISRAGGLGPSRGLCDLCCDWLHDRRCWGQARFQGCLLRQAAEFSWIQGIEEGTRSRRPRQVPEGSGHRFTWPRPPRRIVCGAAPASRARSE